MPRMDGGAGWGADMIPIILADEYSYPLHQSGSISTLPTDDENEAVAMLHEIIKEVTGKTVEKPTKQRIGFLP